MILVSGFNVYPNEVEGVVASHPGVLECAAVGVPDENSGEAVKLFVVKKDPAVTEKEIMADPCQLPDRALDLREQFVSVFQRRDDDEVEIRKLIGAASCGRASFADRAHARMVLQVRSDRRGQPLTVSRRSRVPVCGLSRPWHSKT